MKNSLIAASAVLALALPATARAQDGGAGDTPPRPAPAQNDPSQDPRPAPPPPPPPAPAGPSKASLAVMKFSYHDTVSKTEDGVTRTYLHEFETSALTNKFITALVNTRKFDVVDRDKLDKILQEQQFGESGMLDPQRAVKAGKLIGADYFLTGQISFFTVTQKTVENPYVKGNYTHTVTAAITVDMRIVDTRTGKIVAAEKGEASSVNKFQSQSNGKVEVSAKLLDDLQRDLCDTLSIKTIDGVYPIKVIGWSDGTAFLNRGEGGGLKVGDLLDVFNVGDELLDPDTGASLGATETKIGVARVTSVEPKFSKAQPVQGNVVSFPKGSICRKAKEQAAPAPTEQPKRGPGGW